MSDAVLLREDGPQGCDGVRLLTLNRPERRNALSPDLVAALDDAYPLKILLAEDNLVNQKVAVNLLKQFETLEKVYQSLDEVKGALKTKLENGYESALHSQFLAQIHLNVPMDMELEEFALTGFEPSSPMLSSLRKLGLRPPRSANRLEGLCKNIPGPAEPTKAVSPPP